MRRTAKALLMPILLVAFMPAAAEAAEVTPLSVAQGKRAAKSFAHDVCRERANTCSGSRVKDCESITKTRVDCVGYILQRNSFCKFRIRVVATGGQTVRVDGFGVRCQKYDRG